LRSCMREIVMHDKMLDLCIQVQAPDDPSDTLPQVLQKSKPEEQVQFGAPTGSGRIEDLQCIGSEARLEELAAQKTCPDRHAPHHLPLHMLCANPRLSVDAVKFVGKLYPAAAAIPTSKSCGTFNFSHHFHDVLPLHLLLPERTRHC